AGGDEKAGPRRHDDGGRYPRDGVRPRGRRSTRVHGRRRRRGERTSPRGAGQPETRTDEGLSVQGAVVREADPATPLWRAAQVFRLLSCVYALYFQIAVNPALDRPAVGWALFGLLIAWSAACAVAYLQGFGRRLPWVAAEIVVVVTLILS